MRRTGLHVSIAGGLPLAVRRACALGCTTFQVFCGNPRAWHFGQRSPEELSRFHQAREQAAVGPLFVHACYLVNPCAPDRLVRKRSVARLAGELALARAMGADGYVLHPGSQGGRTADWAVRRAADAVREAAAMAGAAPDLLLENTASAHGPGGSMEALGELVLALRDGLPAARVGVAIDSCHAFAAGYDLRDAAEVERLVEEADEAVGLDAVRLLHVNDSRDAAGSRRDRHAHIGRGCIGFDGLRNLLTHAALAHLPLILETPWESVDMDRRNLRAVRRLTRGPRGDRPTAAGSESPSSA